MCRVSFLNAPFQDQARDGLIRRSPLTPLPPEDMGLTTTCLFIEGCGALVPDSHDINVVLFREKSTHKRGSNTLAKDVIHQLSFQLL